MFLFPSSTTPEHFLREEATDQIAWVQGIDRVILFRRWDHCAKSVVLPPFFFDFPLPLCTIHFDIAKICQSWLYISDDLTCPATLIPVREADEENKAKV